jgi:hypothetical protein
MEILSSIQENRRLLEQIFSNDNELAEIRKTIREETGIRADQNNNYVIATGHQPVPYYPGLLFKNYFTGNHAEKTGAEAYNFIVDSDKGSIKVPVPLKTKDEYQKKMITLKEDPHTIFEGFQPSEKKVKKFLHTIGKHLKTLDKKEFYNTYETWEKEFLTIFKQKHSFIDALTNMLSQLEKSFGFSLVNKKISKIAKSNAYYRFISYIIKHIEKFKKTYNNAVKQRSKNNYQPVKIIHEENGWIELPFWLIKENKRYPVKIKKEYEELKISSEESGVSFSLSTGQWDELAAKLKKNILLYPKATTLTLMIRIFFCDLFVHGTGAVEYELVNNDFIKSFFHLENSLSFYAVTGDIYLPLPGNKLKHEDLQKKYNENKKWLKEAERNPEDMLDQKTAEYYKEKKKKLAIKMKKEEKAENRKKLHQKLENINEEMKTYLKDQKKKIKQEISTDEYILNNENVFLERYYPYFIYPNNTLTFENLQNNIRIKKYSS